MKTTEYPRTEKLITPLGNYINGRFLRPQEISGEISVISPADLSDQIGVFPFSFRDVEMAVTAARIAYQSWKKTSLEHRIDLLKKYQLALKKRENIITETIAREVGKAWWDAKQELMSMIWKVDASIEEGMRPVTDYSLDITPPHVKGFCRYRPHGVMSVIGPFNFPGHLANGHIVPAILMGNSVVFKPSEKSPGVGQWMAECFHEAGLPPGVFNLIQGNGEVGHRLVIHDGVDGVLFTGSYEVGLKIKQDTLHQYWKILALEMGGKNAAVVFDDAVLESAVREVLVGAFLTTGQRCSATSRVIVHEKLLDPFVSLFHEKSKKFKIDHPLNNPFMGPLIDGKSVEKYLRFNGIALREGCESIMRGKQLELPFKGHYVTPNLNLVKERDLEKLKNSIYHQTEVFGPDVAIYSFRELEEAVQLANLTEYGLACSVFTEDRKKYETTFDDLEFGVINWNRSTTRASSKLPFGGLKKSGNHFPSGISASTYCAYPVSSLEVKDPAANTEQFTGLNW